MTEPSKLPHHGVPEHQPAAGGIAARARAAAGPQYLTGLNPEQREAVETLDGRMLAGLIDGWKNRGLTPSQVPSGEAAVFGNGKGGKLYASYQERLKILNAADFGDLLLENIRLFRENPDVLRQYQNRFKFILVDEYQDTNVAQYLWLRLLSQAPSRPGVPLSAIIPGATEPSVIPGRIEDANPESRSNDSPSPDSGSALSAHPGMTENVAPSSLLKN